MRFIVFITIFILYEKTCPCRGEEFRLGILIDPLQSDEVSQIQAAFAVVEQRIPSLKINSDVFVVNKEDMNVTGDQACNFLYKGISMFLDLSYSDSSDKLYFLESQGIPTFKLEPFIFPFMNMLYMYIRERGGYEVTIIVENEKFLESAYYRIVKVFKLSALVINSEENLVNRIKKLRPIPNYFSIIATSKAIEKILNMIVTGDAVINPDKWSVVFLDNDHKKIKLPEIFNNITKITLSQSSICKTLEKSDECNIQSDLQFYPNLIAKAISTLIAGGTYPTRQVDCNDLSSSDPLDFSPNVPPNGFVSLTGNTISFDLEFMITKALNDDEIAQWTVKGVNQTAKEKLERAKDFFRVGVIESKPWNYLNKDGKWEGYCIDFIAALAEKLNFDYTLVTPSFGTFGDRLPNGNWDGLVGDLAAGETDLVVASLLMTAEREEVIDFVAPYFEQTGVSITIRKPVPKTSLFKFMTVLRIEVWLSILASIAGTAILLWFLDRLSPYSARNDKESYPYETRDFTLNECVWFALTSFTPQGGGETPKAVSARILVAAYWLFVTLMLATFTANLAAFLTVERMQAPVQSLEQLGRQSRINYTVVEGSDTHKYFINMKFAEDTLFRLWKELTLNATNDQSQYRVWDYPIKEQYGHILMAINDSNPVANASEGFRLVNEHENADFAFIHDAAEIKYEVTMNCNLTEIGEVFAEQPYAVAVQQGSYLQDEISIVILELQKERFFEGLTEKYWNSSLRSKCGDGSDSEGITLESLGGVFIATLFGLGLSMVVLVFETIYYRRKALKDEKSELKKKFGKSPPPSFKEAIKDVSRDLSAEKKDKTQDVLIGRKDFVPVRTRAGNKPKVSYISVRPRRSLHPESTPPYGMGYFD